MSPPTLSSFKVYRELPAPVHLLCLGMLVNRMGTFLIPFLTIYLRFSLALFIGAPLGGWTFEHLGGQVLWPAALVIGLVGALLLLAIRQHLVVGRASPQTGSA